MLLRPSPIKAFTLLELIVVIVILGLLAALAIPTFARVTKKSQDASTSATLAAVLRDARALMAFQEADASWSSSVETALGETAVPSASGLLAAGYAAPATSGEPTRTKPVLLVKEADAQAQGFAVLSLLSPSGNVCVGSTTLTSSTSPTCVLPQASGPGTAEAVFNGDALSDGSVAPLPVGVVPAGVKAPGAPSAVSALAGVTEATVSWSAPAGDAKSAPTSYVVTPSAGAPVTLTPVDGVLATSVRVTGLTAGTPVTFTVKAVNSKGEAASVTSNPVTPYDRAGAPTGVSATAGEFSATVSWSAPSAENGSPVTGYEVYSSGVLVKAVPDAAARTTSVTGLAAGTARTFTVVALNAGGRSAQSGESPSITPYGALAAPSGVSASAGNASASVAFGSVPGATSYVVTASTGQSASGPSSPVVVPGLVNGTAVTFTVVASAPGRTSSAPSSPSTNVTPSAPVSMVNPYAGTGAVSTLSTNVGNPYGLVGLGSYVYSADWSGQRIFRTSTSTGASNVLAGSGSFTSTDGTGTSASFNRPWGMATDGTSIYVGEEGGKVRKVNVSTGAVTTTATSSSISAVTGLAVLNGKLYLVGNGRVEVVALAGGTPSLLASVPAARTVTTDGTYLYVGTTAVITRVDPSTGAATSLAGGATGGFKDGTGAAASFANPWQLTYGGGSLYVADFGNNRIRAIDVATGVVSTLAGSGAAGAGNNKGTLATFSGPVSITLLGGVLYVGEDSNRDIRKIS